MTEDDGFLSRWSRRKVQVRQGAPVPAAEPAPAPAAVVAPLAPESPDAQAAEPEEPLPPSLPPSLTLDDVATLTTESDFTRFVAPEVSGEVRNAALKKLFSDPHFNVMDGLDTYIDDYNTPDPLPASMLRKMAQAAYLGLVEPEPELENATAQTNRSPKSAPEQLSHACAAGNVPAAIPPAASSATAAMKAHDEDPDLRLQSLHDSGPPGAGQGAGADTEGQR